MFLFRKKIQNFSDHNRFIEIFIILLIVLSIGLTIAEMQWAFTTPEVHYRVFLIHTYILVILLLELTYRFIIAPSMYPKLSPWKARAKFIRHPLTIIDIIVILPLFTSLFGMDTSSGDFIVLRLLRISAFLNIFKLYRSSRVMRLLGFVIREVWNELLITLIMALQIIFICAILTFHFEHGINPTILTFFDSLYYSVIAITTTGFGDIYPVTTGGKAVIMLASIAGVGLVALPAAILSAGFFRALRDERSQYDRKRRKELKHWLHEEEEVDLIPLD